MCDSEEIFQELIKLTKEKEENKIINNLKRFPKEFEWQNLDLLKELLTFINAEILKYTAELIAELAKKESNRKVYTNEQLVEALFKLLDNQDIDVKINTVRALGNICYENEEACKLVEKLGPQKLLQILQNNLKSNENDELTTKTTGLLLNLFNMNDNLIRESLNKGMLPLVQDLLIKYSTPFDETLPIIMFLVSIVNSFEHFLDDMNISFTKELCLVLIDIFKQSQLPEVSVPCLEIFHSQCGQISCPEEIKIIMAKEGICEFLIQQIEKYKDVVDDDDIRSVLKTACDFIVVILTSDECMSLLYDDGNGAVYHKMVSWLNSQDQDLLSTAVLALGNFARKDTNCISMVNTGISKKLLDILERYNQSTDLKDVKIQHALLSTLKNLVIPRENKQMLIKEGLIEVIYPLIKVSNDLVVFKLLGTFRMVIEDQALTAAYLLQCKDFIERLVYWCLNSEHLGVRGEVPRLLAWLVKNCRPVKSCKILLSVPESIKCIVDMIPTNHAVMYNEAFYALNLLYVNCPRFTEDNEEAGGGMTDKFIKILIDANIGININFILNRYWEKMDSSTIENLVVFVDNLCNSEEMIKHLKGVNMGPCIIKLFDNPNVCREENLTRIKSLLLK